ncbi:MAG: alpha-L-fucosidase [Bacteroidales bacterium]
MMRLLLVSLFIVGMTLANAQPYKPNWESIDSRPVPEWFVDAKFGIFIHWGVYAVPAYRKVSEKMYETYAEWYEASVMHDTVKGGREFHVKNFGEDFQYRDFAPFFKAELWDPEYWAEIFDRAGAKYVVLTSKHHDGYCLWPTASPYAKNWNSMDVGPHRDLLGELSSAVRDRGMRMGLYYSLMEWESTPRRHEWSGGTTGNYLPDAIIEQYRIKDPDYVDKHMLPQLKELVMNYQPAVIFSDGEWDKPAEYWKSQEFLAWLYNNAPNKEEVIVNDRWGRDTRGHHGGYYTSEYSSDQEEMSAEHPWEESRGMGESYGYNRAENIDHYNTSEELLFELISIVSRGGNLLLNIGPTADGRIPVIMQQRLVDIGNWLKINGEAIYGTRAWDTALVKSGDTDVYFTRKGKDLYVITHGWPEKDILVPGLKNAPSACTLVGTDINAVTSFSNEGMTIGIPEVTMGEVPCRYGYVFKLKAVL